MKKGPGKQRKRKKNILPYVLGGLFFSFMVISFFQSKRGGQTYLISSEDTYRPTARIKSLVIRNERILPYEEGTVNAKLLNRTLPVGTALGTRLSEKGRAGVQSRIDEIDALLFNLNTQVGEKDKQSPIDDMIYALRQGHYEDNARYVMGFQDAMTYTKAEKKRIEKVLNSEKAYYTSLLNQEEATLLSAGLLVQGTDGYEYVFQTENIGRIRASDYVIPLTDTNRFKPTYKVIDNHKWYLCVVVPIFNGKLFKEGQTLRFDYEGTTYSGTISSQETTRDHQSFVVEMFDGLSAFLHLRSVDITVRYPEEKAFSLPLDALIKRGNLQGVYKRQRLDERVFVPVSVLHRDKDMVTVDAEPVEEGAESLKLYDEIWLHPKEEAAITEEDV